MYIVLVPQSGEMQMYEVSQDGVVSAAHPIPLDRLADVVRTREAARPRWVWGDTHIAYPALLAAGVRVERCVDLRLSHAILRAHPLCAEFAQEPSPWGGPRPAALPTQPANDVVGLFDLEPPQPHADDARDALAELLAQQRALDRLRAADPEAAGRLNFLLAAESAGALVAAEMTHAGIPWDAREHDRLLSELLGPRPVPGSRPHLLEDKLHQVRAALDAPTLNPDSPTELLRALQYAGLPVRTTRSWELQQIDHPAIAPLLEYKKMARLMTANGWHWLDTWVHAGRFHPVYVPGGVVTGRWAADGGGALQLPHQVRSAVRADPGWQLVVPDAAQLEPRILAAMSGDAAMAHAGRGEDMYAGMVASGAVQTRDHAKLGMLGAMYGGTTGESGRMLPRLREAFPEAIALVERAATTGERGGRVQTWLGRTSPAPDDAWQRTQRSSALIDAEAADVTKARSQARSWGRFTRNFVVQGTAAEWALAWIATIRNRLHALNPQPHLVFFLHDEVIVHTPAHLADEVAEVVRDSASEAGRLLFGRSATSVEFPVSIAVVDSYDEAD